jgi:hypothetical protein
MKLKKAEQLMLSRRVKTGMIAADDERNIT